MDADFTQELREFDEYVSSLTRPVSSEKAWQAFEADLHKRMAGEVVGLDWPAEWPMLAKTMGPIEPGTLNVVAAHTSVGKTIFAMQLLRSLAQEGKSCLYVTRELTVIRLIRRHLCAYGADKDRLESGKPQNDDFLAIDAYQRDAQCWKVDYDNTSRATTDIIEKVKREHYDIVFIDYLQALGYDAHSEYGSVTNEVNAIQAMALETNVPVVLISQFRRAQQGKEDKPPHLSDLRGSGAVEERATTAIILHRKWDLEEEERFGKKETIAKVKTNEGWFIVAKNADGESDKFIPVLFDGKRSCIKEVLK